MATVTIILSSAAEDKVRWELDYDDVTLLINGLRCVNDSSAVASSRIWLTTDPTRIYPPNRPLRTQPGTTDFQAIPTTKATQLQIVMADHNGRTVPSNLDGEFVWPAV